MNIAYLVLVLGLVSFVQLVNCELGCKDLPDLGSFESIVEFTSSGQKSIYIEETKDGEYGKLLIRHGNGLQQIYYREKQQKFILFETTKNQCAEHSFKKEASPPADIGEFLYVYQMDKILIGPAAIYQQFANDKTVWTNSTTTQRNIECMVCETPISGQFLGLTDSHFSVAVRERNGELEPVRLEVKGKNGKDPVTYVFDYLMFKNRLIKPVNPKGKLDRRSNEFVLDMPLIGCPDASFLGDLPFSLYLPDILKLQLRRPKSKTEKEQPSELLDIIYDKVNNVIRVDNFQDGYYEVADLNSKNFYHFENGEQCTPFYRAEQTPNLEAAVAFVKQVQSLATMNFYHVGQKLLDGDVVAQVFELATTENEAKRVTTLYTREILCLNEKKLPNEQDEEKEKPKLKLLKLVHTAYKKAEKNEQGYVETSRDVYNVDDYSELHYDENYRLLFDLRACTQNFRDRAYIAFDAAFDKKTNPNKVKLPDQRIEQEEENVKTQLSKLIKDTLTSSILSIQYVQYHVATSLQVQTELINTNSYVDEAFVEFEDSPFTKNPVDGSMNECAFKSYDQPAYLGFRFCYSADQIRTGTCYLVDDKDAFQKRKVPPKLFLALYESRLLEHLLRAHQHSEESSPDAQPDEPTDGRLMADDDKNPDDDKKKLNCALFKKLNDQPFTPPLIKRLSELEAAVKAGKFKIEFKDNSKNEDDGASTPKPNDKKDGDKEKQPLILNFNSLSFSPNEKLFPVEKQSGAFEMVAANQKIRPDYAYEESSSENTNLKSLNDCYLHCLASKTDRLVCHSFAFCLDADKKLAKCQLSTLYFEDSMGGINQATVTDMASTPSDDGGGRKDPDYSKYLEDAPSCSTFNLMFSNYFRPINNRKMEANFAFATVEDYTQEQCLEECHSHTKSKESDTDDTMCRLVEYCTMEESADDNGMQKKSTCMMSKEYATVLPIKDPEKETNCQLYDWNYLNDYHQIDDYAFDKVHKPGRFITQEMCAERCTVEPYCKHFKFCYSPTYDHEENQFVGTCIYESDEDDYVDPDDQVTVLDEKISHKCVVQEKNNGLLIHHDTVLDDNSTMTKYRKKYIVTRNKDEVLSKTFWTLNVSLFLSSIFVVFILVIAYKKFYNRYRNDPHQSYTSFFSRKR